MSLLSLLIPTLTAPVRRADAGEMTAESLRSGPGAPMFEQHGPSTRIRRAPVRAIARFTAGAEAGDRFGQVLNISPGGCLLKTESTLAVGTVLELRVTILGRGEPVQAELSAVVRRVTREDNRRAYGLEFVALSSEEGRDVQRLYAQAMGA